MDVIEINSHKNTMKIFQQQKRLGIKEWLR